MATSTLPQVKAQLVTLLTAALATSSVDGGQVPVFYAWQPDVTDECVFLGRALLPGEDVAGSLSTVNSEISTIKAGRKRRTEEYTVDLTCWSWRADLDADDHQECEARVHALFAEVEDVFADDAKLGLTSILWAQIRTYDVLTRPHPTGSGLVSQIIASVEVQARLT